MAKKWYWIGDALDFQEIMCSDKVVWDPEAHGPFDSFRECKKDAMSYYRVSRDHAIDSMRQIGKVVNGERRITRVGNPRARLAKTRRGNQADNGQGSSQHKGSA